MEFSVINEYTRRGNRISVTIEITNFGILYTSNYNDEGIGEYSTTYGWCTLLYENESFKLEKQSLRTHHLYPIQIQEEDIPKIELIVNLSKVAVRARKSMVNRKKDILHEGV